MIGFVFVLLAICIAIVVSAWKVYAKAGKPGWAAFVPIYNVLVLLEIVGRPWWWLFLMIIPVVNVIIGLILCLDLGKSFGKTTAFSICFLWLFSFVGWLILGFGKDQYIIVNNNGGGNSQASPPPEDMSQSLSTLQNNPTITK